MGVVTGPSDLAGRASSETQAWVSDGIGLLAETSAGRDGNGGDDDDDDEKTVSDGDDMASSLQLLLERHERDVLAPLQSSLFWTRFYSDCVGTYVAFFSSFLTAIVVITMSWQVYYGEMDSSEFLGLFFVFKQLQKPATKMSGILKKLAGRTANLQRINGIVFEEAREGADEEADPHFPKASKETEPVKASF